MLPTFDTELTAEQIEQLEAAKKAIPKLREQIRKAKLAGIDTAGQENDLAALESNINKLYNVYVRRITSG